MHTTDRVREILSWYNGQPAGVLANLQKFMMTGRLAEAIPGLFGALFGAGVLGWGAGWIGSLTGQQM